MPLSTFEQLLAGVLHAVILTDDSGVIRFVNAEAERLFGWLREELVGQQLETLMPERFHGAHLRHRAGYAADPQSRPMDKRVVVGVRRDGSEFPLELTIGRAQVDGAVLIIAIAHLVAAETSREREAWDQVKRLQLVNRVNQAGVRCEDLPSLAEAVMFELGANELAYYASLAIVSADRSVAHVLARTRTLPGEQSGAPMQAVPGRLKRDVYTIEALGAEAVLLGEEVTYTDLAASARPAHLAIARLGMRSALLIPCEPADRVQTLLLVARREPGAFSSVDREFFRALAHQFWVASDHVRLAEAQRRVEEVVAQQWQVNAHQERLAVLGAMAAGVVHDIHNAITPVLCLAELELSTPETLDPNMRDVLQQIHLSARDVVQVATRMRALVKGGEAPARRVPVELNAIVRQVIQMSRVRWRDAAQAKGIAIRIKEELDSDLPHFSAAESEVREALLNLVLNAVDAMPYGGDLALRTRSTTRNGVLHAVVEVSDTGVGMDAATVARCLEPYFTTKGDGGTGLGLVSVQMAAEQHGGRLDIRSALGAGTTVALELPVVHDQPQEEAPRSAPSTRSLQVLVVDDEPLVLRVMGRMLAHLGHEAVVVDSAEGALQALREMPLDRQFDVVLTDLGMPLMNGRDLARHIRKTWPNLPVVLMTGWVERADAEGEPMFAGRLAKPPSVDSLRQALENATRQEPHVAVAVVGSP